MSGVSFFFFIFYLCLVLLWENENAMLTRLDDLLQQCDSMLRDYYVNGRNAIYFCNDWSNHVKLPEDGN